MAKIHGLPGEMARVRGTLRGLWPLFLVSFFIGTSFGFFLLSILAGMAVLIVSLALLPVVTKRSLLLVERYFKGARGEEKICNILEGLSDSYHVFNDFGTGTTRADHVVVGPTGVYAIETKLWRGRVTVEDDTVLLDGALPDRDPLRQARREAELVRTIMKPLGWTGSVTPVLAFASNTFAPGHETIGGTLVINGNELKSSFAKSRVSLGDAELERLVMLMETIR